MDLLAEETRTTQELDAVNDALERLAPSAEAFAQGGYVSYSPNLLQHYHQRKAELELELKNLQLIAVEAIDSQPVTLLLLDVPNIKVQGISDIPLRGSLTCETLQEHLHSHVAKWHNTPVDVSQCVVIDVSPLNTSEASQDGRFWRIALTPDIHANGILVENFVRKELLPANEAYSTLSVAAWLTAQMTKTVDWRSYGLPDGVWSDRIPDRDTGKPLI